MVQQRRRTMQMRDLHADNRDSNHALVTELHAFSELDSLTKFSYILNYSFTIVSFITVFLSRWGTSWTHAHIHIHNDIANHSLLFSLFLLYFSKYWFLSWYHSKMKQSYEVFLTACAHILDCVQKVNYNQHNSAKETQLVSSLLEEHGELRFGYLETNSGCGTSEISINPQPIDVMRLSAYQHQH